jgi:hypothetical protein
MKTQQPDLLRHGFPKAFLAALPVVALLAGPLRADEEIAWEDPRSPEDNLWTTVQVTAPAGTQLCVSGLRLPADTRTFWVRPQAYSVTTFGDGLLRTTAMIDAEYEQSDIALAIAPQPDVMGTWTGDMDGVPLTLTLTAAVCDQPDCQPDLAFTDGVSGQMRAPGDEAGSTWQLWYFVWIPDKNVVAFAAMQMVPNEFSPTDLADASGEPSLEIERSFWLELAADGSLVGNYTLAAEEEWAIYDDPDDPDGADPAPEHPITLRRVGN